MHLKVCVWLAHCWCYTHTDLDESERAEFRFIYPAVPLWRTWSMIRLQNYASDWGQRMQRIQSVRCRCTPYELRTEEMSRYVDKMGQREWGKGPKSRNMAKLSYKLCISSSDRGKCLLAWIIHCLGVSLAFFFLEKQEKFGRVMLFYTYQTSLPAVEEWTQCPSFQYLSVSSVSISQHLKLICALSCKYHYYTKLKICLFIRFHFIPRLILVMWCIRWPEV